MSLCYNFKLAIVLSLSKKPSTFLLPVNLEFFLLKYNKFQDIQCSLLKRLELNCKKIIQDRRKIRTFCQVNIISAQQFCAFYFKIKL